MAGLLYMDETKQTILACDTNNDLDWMGSLSHFGATTNLEMCPVTRMTNAVPGVGIAGTASTAWCAWPPDAPAPYNGSYSINGWLYYYDPNANFSASGWVSPPPPPVVNNPQFVFSKPMSVQRPAQTPFFNDAVVWNEWTLKSDESAQYLSQGAYNTIWGMPRCTIMRHGGKTATSKTLVRTTYFPPYSLFPSDAAINVGFADGHVQLVKLQNLWNLYWHNDWSP
jgi:prepilin-type processing-associated H-X9-DG protein